MTCPGSHGGDAGVTRSAGVLFPRGGWNGPVRSGSKFSVWGAHHPLRGLHRDPPLPGASFSRLSALWCLSPGLRARPEISVFSAWLSPAPTLIYVLDWAQHKLDPQSRNEGEALIGGL